MKNNNHIQHNPTDKLIIPKKIKTLPHSIDISSIDKLLNSPILKPILVLGISNA